MAEYLKRRCLDIELMIKIDYNFMIGIKSIAIALSVITFCLCACQGQRGNGQVDGNVSDTIDYGEVNDSLVMKYISCPKSIVDTLLDKGDSIYLHANEYILEFLGLDNEEYNRRLVAKYGDTIPAIVSIYESYDLLTSYGEDEVCASFVWQEVAKTHIYRFLKHGSKTVVSKDYAKFFHVIDDIMDYYSGGTQRDMTIAARRLILVADYHLIEAYKHLMDLYDDHEIKKLVHEDYRYVLKTYREYVDFRYEQFTYSDLLRQLNCLLYGVLNAKAASINNLIKRHAGIKTVMNNLRGHYCQLDNKMFKLTFMSLEEEKWDIY